MGFADTQISILPAITGSAMCVQRFDDSRGYADRITYRISLRSSSLWEPRHPLLKVVWHLRHMRGGELTHKIVRTSTAPSFLHVKLTNVIDVCFYNIIVSTTISQSLILEIRSSGHLFRSGGASLVVMILPQVHLRKPCYDFTFL